MRTPSESFDDVTVGGLSEGEILGRILARIGTADQAIVGPGDDAAVLRTDGAVVLTIDTLVHGPDFRLAWSSGFDLGWKAAAVNLSDVAAMGARPTALLVALAIPNETRISFVEDLADGLREACAALAPGCTVVGGDLTVSETLTIAVTAIGSLEGRAAVLRSRARPGDVIAIAGDVGRAAEGLEILFTRFSDASGQPIAVDPDALSTAERQALAAQLRPTPPVAAGVVAAESGASALIDVSDGLALDARRLADASGVTLDLDLNRIAPGATEREARRALGGGEDHALLATFPSGAVPAEFREIGTVVPRGDTALLVDGAPFDGRAGWDPYRDWDHKSG